MHIPVTVLTGFLGSGKTTLLNRVLSEHHGKNYAVIVNEFGEIGIDNDLIVDADEEVFEMNNGCVCCTVRGDLIRIVSGLLRRRTAFDGILVETTGIAQPAPVAQTFFVDDDLRAKTKLDAIITVVDAHTILDRLGDTQAAAEQIAFADRLILNKIDLVDNLAPVEARLHALNPFARVIHTTRAHVPLDQILNQGAFDLTRALALEPDFLGHSHHQDHNHHGHDHHHNHSHLTHDQDITSLSLSTDKPLNGRRFMEWVHKLSADYGQNLLRWKGIMHFQGEERRFILQAVHMIIDADFQRPWQAEEKRLSRLVLIGRHLDRSMLTQGFEACIA